LSTHSLAPSSAGSGHLPPFPLSSSPIPDSRLSFPAFQPPCVVLFDARARTRSLTSDAPRRRVLCGFTMSVRCTFCGLPPTTTHQCSCASCVARDHAAVCISCVARVACVACGVWRERRRPSLVHTPADTGPKRTAQPATQTTGHRTHGKRTGTLKVPRAPFCLHLSTTCIPPFKPHTRANQRAHSDDTTTHPLRLCPPSFRLQMFPNPTFPLFGFITKYAERLHVESMSYGDRRHPARPPASM